MATKPKTVRQDLGSVITEVFDRAWLLGFAEDVKGMTKGMWGSGRCPECGSTKKVMVDVPDLKGQLAAITELLEQAEGRPGTAQGEVGGVTLIVERTWPTARVADSDELHAAAPAKDVSPIAG